MLPALYDLALDPSGWVEVMDRLAGHMNAKGAVLTLIDPTDTALCRTAHSSLFTFADIAEFDRQWADQDRDTFLYLLKSDRLGFRSDMEALGLDRLEDHAAHPPVAYLEARYGVRHRAASRLSLHGLWKDLMAVQYDCRRGPITPDEAAVGDFLAPHFGKLLEISRTFTVLRSRYNATLTVLDRLMLGVFICTASATVALSNSTAAGLIERRDAFRLASGGRLTCMDEDSDARLKMAIARACDLAAGVAGPMLGGAAGDSGGGGVGESLTVAGRGRLHPYLISVAPLCDGQEADFGSGCLVTVIDPDSPRTLAATHFDALFGLTRAEMETCGLMLAGLSTRDIAETRRVSPETARSQTKAVLAKAGAKGRTDLIRLAATLNPPLDAAPLLSPDPDAA